MSAAVWWYLARASGLVAWGLVTATGCQAEASGTSISADPKCT